MLDLDLLLFAATTLLVIASPMTAGLLQGRARSARNGEPGAAPHGAPDWQSYRPLVMAAVSGIVMAIWGVLAVPVHLAAPTVLLAWGLQAVVLLTGPDPKGAQGFAGALTVLGLAVAIALLHGGLILHVGATLLALALWLTARLQKAVAPDALFLLLPAGAFTGFAGLALTGFLAIPAALLFRLIKPFVIAKDDRRPVMPAEAIVFGLAAALWLVWLYMIAN